MADVNDWEPELDSRTYKLEMDEDEYALLLERNETDLFFDFADDRGALLGRVDLEPWGDPVIEYTFSVADDTPENHAKFLKTLADYLNQ